MKKLYYEEGPLVMGCGEAGEFRIGEPREVADDLAETLLRKGRLKEFVNPTPAAKAAHPEPPSAPLRTEVEGRTKKEKEG